MKKFFSKFLKDTRGVVMMEYVVLGCFAVAITVVTVMALGKTYNNGLAVMAFATAGETKAAQTVITASKSQVTNDVVTAIVDYAPEFESTGNPSTGFTYSVYTPAP